jgi:hypothetical protein
MNRQSGYRELMEQIRRAHQAFATAWAKERAAALATILPKKSALSWNEIWEANGVAYKAAQPLADRRNHLMGELFRDHLGSLDERFQSGDPDAVHAIIDFLEVDVPAFQCGYAKEHYLRKLKTIELTDEHRERLRQYGLRLCRLPQHRREIANAGRLMILIANREFVEELRELANSDSRLIKNRASKMLAVVQNGRKDLL